MEKPILYALWDPPEGLPKTSESFSYIYGRPNSGDLVFIFAGALFSIGDHPFEPWNFLPLDPEEVNARFSKLVMFLPCRIIEASLDSGFYFDRVTDFLERLTIPVISASESILVNDYEYRSDLHLRLSPQAVRYLRTVAERTPLVGTRGAYSAEVLKRLGISNVEAIGCPSMFMNGPALPEAILHRRPFEELREIALGYSNNPLGRSSLIGAMLQVAGRQGFWFIEQHLSLLARILYWPGKISPKCLAEAHRLYQGYSGIRELLRQRKVRYFTSLKLWMDFMGKLDFFFGSRLHGGIMGVQAGVPSYFILQDARVREVCEYFKLPSITEAEVRRQGIDVRRFYEAADYSEAVRAYPGLYRRFVDYLRTNGIDQNVAPDGSLISRRIPEPVPEAQDELDAEHTLYSEAKDSLLDLLFALGEQWVQGGATAPLDRAIRHCGQLMYDSHNLLGRS